ncbi:MAG TPA: hypothetical protein HA256_07950 [Methanoregulaceae archaeon]|nr:hypothetical protein [Methanoregulaceae archaeon]
MVQRSRFPPVWHFSRGTVSAGLTGQDDRVRQGTFPEKDAPFMKRVWRSPGTPW